MSFEVFADGSANLPLIFREGINLLPCEYTLNGEPKTYLGDLEAFDAHGYYEGLKNGMSIRTSLLNSELFLTHFTPVLEQGRDVIYISMASGISGTYNAARIAAQQLNEAFPDRFVHVVDSKGCGCGTGMVAIKAAELSREGKTAREAAGILEADVPFVCQYFTVDDLNYLRRTGRVAGIAAKVGSVLAIKPILFGADNAHIEAYGNVRGRRRAVEELAKIYEKKHQDIPQPRIFISHADSLTDAERLRQLVLKVTPDADITTVKHEPFSGAHVGPGMLAIFFRGTER